MELSRKEKLSLLGAHGNGSCELRPSSHIVILAHCSPLNEKIQHLLRCSKGSISSQEHVDVGRLDLTGVGGGQVLHQAAQGAGLHETHPDGFPLEVRDAIIGILMRGASLSQAIIKI